MSIAIEAYFKESINFINSLTIKIDDIRTQQELQLYIKNNTEPPSKEESKYYKNLAGELSVIDIPVYITLPEQGDVLFNRELLRTYPVLKWELMKYDSEFNKLLLKNPGMSDYIRGVLATTTKSEALTRANYSIIHFKDGYLGENEGSVIIELNLFIKNFFTTYHNERYLIDELYLASLFSNLFNGLLLTILNIKFKNTYTNKVDKFHLGAKINSFKSLYNSCSLFNSKSTMWIYGNLNRMKHFIGANHNLDSILDKVYDENLYGINKTIFNKSIPTLLIDDYNNMYKPFYKKEYKFINIAANKSATALTGKEYNIEELNQLFNANKLISNKKHVNNDMERDLLVNSNLTTNLTKSYVIDTMVKVSAHYHNNLIVGLSSTIFNINNGVKLELDYLNKLDMKVYTLNEADIENLLAWHIYTLGIIDNNDFDIKCSGVFTKDLSREFIINDTWHREELTDIYDYLTANDVLYSTVYNLETMQEHILATRELEPTIWYLVNNLVDNNLKADVVKMTNNLLKERLYSYKKDEIDTYIASRGLDKIIMNPNTFDSLVTLTEAVTGLVINAEAIIKTNFEKLIYFFNNTTSYTVNLMMDLGYQDNNIIMKIDNDIALGYKPLLEIKGAVEAKPATPDYFVTVEQLDTRDNVELSEMYEVCIETAGVFKEPLYSTVCQISDEPLVLAHTPRYTPNLITTIDSNTEILRDMLRMTESDDKLEAINLPPTSTDIVTTSEVEDVITIAKSPYSSEEDA